MLDLQLVALGWCHENAPVELRDRLSLDPVHINAFILKAMENDSINELGILSTCNRTEFYFITNAPQNIQSWVNQSYRDICRVQMTDADPAPYIYYNRQGVRHLFAVSAGMKSMMLGENQILHQVKTSYEILNSSGQKAPVLSHLFRDAIRAGKAVRTNTDLCRGAVSISFAAAELSHKIFSDISQHHILLIGAGKTSELVAKHFREIGAVQFTIANRGEKRRNELAEKVDGTPVPLEEVPNILGKMDVVVAATDSQEHLIRLDMVKKAMRQRNDRPVLMIDISTPRNIDPAIHNVEEIFLFDIDHLQDVIADNLEKRKKELPSAQKVVDEISDEFMEWYKGLKVTPTISRLAQYFESIRAQELDKFKYRVDDKHLEYLDQLSRGLIRKLLHYPITHLKEMSNGQQLDPSIINTIWKLYKLDQLEIRKGKDE